MTPLAAASPILVEPKPDDRLPVVFFDSVSCTAGKESAKCVIVNNTRVLFSYSVRAKGVPAYVLEPRRNGSWPQITATANHTCPTRAKLLPWGTAEFVVDLSGLQGPFRLRLDLYKDSESTPVAVLSREIQLLRDVTVRTADVPVIPCDLVPPKLIHRIEPGYPRLAMLAGIQDTVVLDVVVERSGHVRDVRVLWGDSIGIFVEPAIEAVKQWRYAPPRDVRGRSVAVCLTVHVRFELAGAGKSAD